MKPSKYNYVIPYEDNVIFYNGLTEKFFSVRADHKDTYEAILSSPDDYDAHVHFFIEKMKSYGFILDDATDEMTLVREKFEAQRMSHQYFLMVLPTYQCNLRCWYCIQNHENMFMADDTLENIKKRIILKLENPDITEFYLSWFGGEPLLAYDKVLELTSFARDFCHKNGKKFSCGITTNGTLLTPSRIEALREAGVGHYQITIDGDRETHNSIKQLGNGIAYDTTLSNINLIAKHSHVNLRFNYTHENLKPDSIFSSLRSVLNPEITENITFTIFKVWQEKQELVSNIEVDRLFNLSKQTGMRPSLSTTGLCYTDRVHFDCIFPNGYVGKCDNHNPEEMSGILQSDGSINWVEDMEVLLYGLHLFDGSQTECEQCCYLTICWGPCVAKREAMLRSEGKITCYLSDRKETIESIVINQCKTETQNTSCQIL